MAEPPTATVSVSPAGACSGSEDVVKECAGHRLLLDWWPVTLGLVL